MVPALLLLFALVLVVGFITENPKFSTIGIPKETLKQAKGAEVTGSCQKQVHYLQAVILVVKLSYYRYIEGLPNYEAAQRVMAKLGNNLRFRLPFASTEYQVIADPVYAKRIMADPSWPERVPVGYCLQDARFHKPYGLFFGGGKHWKPASRITAKLFQQLGFFNPATMEGRFVFEMEELERKFETHLALNGDEHTFCPHDIFGRLSINVIFHILLGKRNPFDEAVVAKLMNSITTTNKKMAPGLTLLEIIPFLRHFPKLTFLGDFIEMSDIIYDVLRAVVAQKIRAGRYRDHVEDFVDGLLQHVDKSVGGEDGLNEENMLVVLRDMFAAGADTTSATLEHGLLFMAIYPKVQEKLQAEIDGVIGPDRAPSYQDRRRMPYTEATLLEIYRNGTPVPGAARAKHVGSGCSFALVTLYGIHRNELYFDKPNEFKPERFLDNEDSTKIVNTENLMPFGYGRRSCPGETAARVAVFIYFVTMLQRYTIRLSSHHPPPSMKNTHGLSRSPLPYYVTITRRH